jgi:hypothetical protein
MLDRRKAPGALAIKRPPAPVLAIVIGLFAVLAVSARFDVLPTRDDTWIFDRSTNRICTLGLEVVERPCWPALAAGLSRWRLVRPGGADWTVRAADLQGAAGSATGPCADASVWYADGARNLFLSDGHAYAVKAPLPLPFRDTVRVCGYPGRPGLYTLARGRDAAPAVRMR